MFDVLKDLALVDNQVTSQIIEDLIDEHAPTRAKTLALYERYKTDSVPVFDRKFDDEGKINRKLNNSFDSEIIDTKVGYFIGYPISYQVDDEQDNAEAMDKVIQNFNYRSDIADLDSETVKMATICGYAGRLLYIDVEGEERAMLLYPWETIAIYDRSIHELQYAMRYYTITVKEGKDKKELTRVEWYDKEKVTFYIESRDGKGFVLDDTEPVNPQLHLFDEVPIVIFVNNDEQQGDTEKVLELIDAYDRTLSDINSEIEEFRLAYMLFYGYAPDEEVMKKARKTGAFGLDTKDEGVGAEFLTKQLNDQVIENHLNRLEANVLRFANSINMTDESFAGNASGVAIKYKLTPLENKCITLERKMTAALRQQFKILCTAWAKKGINLDYLNVFFGFKRNLPVNINDEADSTGKLKGMVSERTRLGLLSFVDDVEWEIEEMEKDSEGMLNLDNIEFEEEEEAEEEE